MHRSFTVASANLHAGIDGWGRPFDAVGGCTALGADILLIQENWRPEGGASIAEAIAEGMGASYLETTYATGRRGHPMPGASDKWLSKKGFIGHDHSLYFDSVKPLAPKLAARTHYRDAEPGSWGTAIVTRFPILRSEVIDLPYLRRDRSHRRPLIAELDVDGVVVTVFCVHMSHLTYGSPLHFKAFNELLEQRGAHSEATIIGGDMNNWGWPLVAQVRHLRRAVRQRTWPAWRPHSQLDHLLVSDAVVVDAASAGPDLGSDHLPVVATVHLDPNRPHRPSNP